MNNYQLIILTFIVTGLWDVLLRLFSLNYNSLPSIMKNYFPFIGYLTPYFEHHTMLAAALIAGFIGATAQVIIISILKFPTLKNNLNYNLLFLFISFIISALYGFIMKLSKLFPYLDTTYYKNLGTIRGMYHDGISGLIVQITIYFLLFIQNYLK